jgi:tetratricopeptide (TPR) repeat protein
MALKQNDQAHADFHLAIQYYPRNAFVYYINAELHFKESDFEEAIQCINQALAIAPDYPDALYLRANALRSLYKHDAALKDIEALLEIDPENDRALSLQGELYRMLCDYDKALKSLELSMACRLDPSPMTLYIRSLVYANMGQYKKSLADIDEANLLSCETDFSMACIGHINFLHNQYQTASEALEKMLRMNPKDVFALAELGLILLKSCHFHHRRKEFSQARIMEEKALASIDLALKYNPKDFTTLSAMGSFFYQQRDNKSALAYFQRTLELVPHEPNALAYRGVIYFENQEFEKAEADISRCLEMNPWNITALDLRAKLYQTRKEYSFALQDHLRKHVAQQDQLQVPSLLSMCRKVVVFREPEVTSGIGRCIKNMDKNKALLKIASLYRCLKDCSITSDSLKSSRQENSPYLSPLFEGLAYTYHHVNMSITLHRSAISTLRPL